MRKIEFIGLNKWVFRLYLESHVGVLFADPVESTFYPLTNITRNIDNFVFKRYVRDGGDLTNLTKIAKDKIKTYENPYRNPKKI